MGRTERFFLSAFVTLCLAGCGGGGHGKAPAIHYGQSGGAAGSAGMHTVAGRDTLWDVSQRYRLSVQDIIAVNALQPPYQLEMGQRLILPPPQVYKVRGMDSLYSISRTFNVSMTELARLNSLQPPYALHDGQMLRLPIHRPAAAPRMVAAEMANSVSPYQAPGAVEVETIAAPASVTAEEVPQQQETVVASRATIPKDTPPRAGSKFKWPVRGPVISSYGPKKDGLHNDGINIKAPAGSPVQAADNGVVVYAGNELKGFGNLVLVRHADRWVTAYGHLDRMLVTRGQEIRQGQTIGAVGSTGSVTTPQLHFEVRRGTEALNPLGYLQK